MSATRTSSISIIVFWLLTCAAVTGQEPSPAISQIQWRTLGPGVCGANFAVGFHAKNPKIMLGGTDMGAAYRTDDSGKSWQIVGSQREGESQPGCSHGVWRATFDPKQPHVAWLGSQFGAHKSIDGGRTWKRVTAPITGKPMMVQCIGIDPTDSDIVYIGQGWAPRSVQSWVRGRVWKTLDGGTTWEELARPGGPVDEDTLKARSYTNIIVDPNSPFRKGRGHARVYIFGRGGLFVSETAGATWMSLSENLPSPEVDDMVLVDNNGRSTLFATIHAWLADDESRPLAAGVYRSDNNGQSWVARNVGLEKELPVWAQRNGPRRQGGGQSTLMLAHSPAAPNVLYAGSQRGIFRSDDQGETWVKKTRPNSEWVKIKDYDGRDTNYNLTRHGGNFVNLFSLFSSIDAFHILACAPSDPNYVAFTDNDTIRLSRDGGETWEDVMFEYGEPFDEGRFGDRPPMTYTHRTRSRGAQFIVARDAAVDPFDSDTITIAYHNVGLRISRDAGNWWEHATRGIIGAGSGRTQAYSIVYDPAVRGRAYVAVGRMGRVYVTEDGGRTFKQRGIQPLLAEAERQWNRSTKDNTRSSSQMESLAPLPIWKLALDPQSAADSRTLYAATAAGIYKTTDGGRTWNESSRGLAPGSDLHHLVVNSKDPKILYTAWGHRTEKEPPHGLFRSIDAGRSWTRLAPDKIGAVWSLSLCTGSPKTVYATANEPGQPTGTWNKAKLWRTNDGGRSWQLVDDRRGACVAVHPKDPERIYYATFAFDLNAERTGFWGSSDGGRHWRELGRDIPLSYPMKAICFDQADPSRFFLLNGFCVYEGRDLGTPRDNYPNSKVGRLK